MNLTDLAATVHQANRKWWEDVHTGLPIKRNKGELLALIHSEISECADGEYHGLNDDKLPHRRMGEVECVDALIRVLDYSAGFDHRIGERAELIGLSEFIDLNHLVHCVRREAIEDEIVDRGLDALHSLVSKVLEHERKGRVTETRDALVELVVGICTYAHLAHYDLQGAYVEKMAFNATREDHQHEARRIAGGKQF